MLRMDETSMPRKNQASIRTIRVPLFLPLLVALKKISVYPCPSVVRCFLLLQESGNYANENIYRFTRRSWGDSIVGNRCRGCPVFICRRS